MKINRREFIKKAAASAAICTPIMLIDPYILYPRSSSKHMKEAKYYEKNGDKEITCLLCPHECIVENHKRGICGVRENKDGTYYTLVYANPCAAHIDPIEKKPMFHYYPSTQSFSIATAGCNFTCSFCQNWEMSQKRPEKIKSITLLPSGVVKSAKRYDCKTIAHTYTEPVIFFEYMLDCAIEGKKHGVPNVMISNGYIQEKPMRELCKYLGAVKIDLKAFYDKFYKEVCGGRLKPVMDTLLVLKDEGIWFEIVVLIIPTLNDSAKEIDKMTKWIVKELGVNVPLHFSRFYPTYKMKNIPPTPPSTLKKARKIAMGNGIKFAYIGNIISDAENTYCPECGKLLIERMRLTANIVGMKKNRCKYCGEIIPGVF